MESVLTELSHTEINRDAATTRKKSVLTEFCYNRVRYNEVLP